MFFKTRLVAIVRVGIVAVAAASQYPAEASTLTWALPTITFEAGQTATGTFTVDQQLDTLTDWSVQVSGGSNPTLTNLDFQPAGRCVVFCGGLFATSTPAPSGIDFRTPIASDNTFFELTLYFNAPLSDIFNPSGSTIELNGSGTIDYEELLSSNIVAGLQQSFVTNTGSSEVVPIPEAAPYLSFALSSTLFAAFNRSRGRSALGKRRNFPRSLARKFRLSSLT